MDSEASGEKLPLIPHVKIVEQTKPDVHLDRRLSTVNGIMIMVGVLVGSGVFVSPGLVVKRTPNFFIALAIWIIFGLLIVALMSVAIELGSLFSRPGSHYVYIQKTLGHIPAFMYIWTLSTVITPAAFAVVLNTMGRYASQPFFSDQDSTSSLWTSKLIGAVVIVILCVINSFGIRTIARFQFVFTGIQISFVILVVAMGIWDLSVTGNFTHFEPRSFFNNTDQMLEPANLGELGKAMYNTLWAYDGWMLVSTLTEEFVNPEKSLPIVAFTSSLFTIFVYILLNLAYFAVLSKEEMGAAKTAGIALVEKVAGKKATLVMPFLVALSLLGCLNGSIIGNSRIYLSAARDGSLPGLFTLIDEKRKSPVPAIWFICGSSLVWLFVVKTTEDVIQYFNAGQWVFFGMAIFGCLIHKYRAKDVHRPYKTFTGTPIFLCLVSVVLVVCGFIGRPLGTGVCWIWILSSLIVYYVFIHKKFLSCSFLHRTKCFLEKRCNMVQCQ